QQTDQLNLLINGITDFLKTIELGRNLEKEIPPEQLDKVFKGVPALLTLARNKCLTLIEGEKISEQERLLLSAITLLQGVKTSSTNFKKASESFNAAKKSWTIADHLYDTFVSVKKAKVQSVFDLIQQDIQKFYSILHPGDAYINIKLKQPTGRRASLELKIDSFGHTGEDPRAFSSEGHLDSLGLCIFLAFVRKFNQDCSLVVLDDVVTTVDAKHRDKICELLANEFADKQLIITTHETYWLRQLRQYHMASGLDSQYHYREIKSWDLSTGPVFYPFKLRWESIQAKIDAGDRTAGNECRVHLEWVLKQICESIQSQVPFRTSAEYVIGDLLPAAKSRAMRLIPDGQYKEDIKKAFRDLECTIICGNLLSHDNIMADELVFDEIRVFCESVHKLYAVFTCPSCGSLLKYYADLAIIRCPYVKCTSPFETKTKT
ncbi:MAG: hypothetical protein J7K77_01955, partial [Dehalococcoidales bacterium]|nr:hypothetical protein [Dehalococcoidales bacterium]